MDDVVDGAADTVLLEEVRRLLAAGEVVDAMDLLSRSTADAPTSDHLVAVRDARHRYYDETRFPARTPRSLDAAPVLEQPGIPEVSASDLDATVLRAAFEQRGSLLVRGLLSAEWAERLRVDAEQAIAAYERHAREGATPEAAPWYAPFDAAEPYSFGPLERLFTASIGGVLTVESPRALSDVISAFYDVGLPRLLEDHLGERPALSAKKSTLRRARPDSPTEWHQDGAFLGAGTPSVNVWVALNDCGIDAPSLDVFPVAYDHIVSTGGDSALFDWSVSVDDVARESAADIVRPVFGPGDALIFNQLTLHRSGIDPAMTKTRYAIESWFFGPSQYPYEQVPILF